MNRCNYAGTLVFFFFYLMFHCPGCGEGDVCLPPRAPESGGAMCPPWPCRPASCRSARVSGGWAGASVSPRALWVTDTAAARWGPRDHWPVVVGTCDGRTQSSPQTPPTHWAGGGVHTTISIHVSISFSCVFFHYQKLWTIILTLDENFMNCRHTTHKKKVGINQLEKLEAAKAA